MKSNKFDKLERKKVFLILTAVFCFLAISMFFVFKGGLHMQKPIIMDAGDPVESKPFDATKWFASGMYKRRKVVVMGEERDSNVSMLRVDPPPFTEQQNDHIAEVSAGALLMDFPQEKAAIMRFYDTNPELRHRMVYRGSGFDNPEKPVDAYRLYLTIGEKRYTIGFSRDGVSGNLEGSGTAYLTREDDYSDMEVFKKLEEQERKQKR